MNGHTYDLSNRPLMLFIRHAVSEKNRLGYHGHSERRDHPLTADGRREAELLAQALRNVIPVRTIVASASRSTQETAAVLAAARGVSVETRLGLRAVGMGIIADLTTAEIKTQYPRIFDQLQQFEAGKLHPQDLQLPGRESFRDFAERIQAETDYLAAREPPVVVVAHHSALTMLVHTLRLQAGDPTLNPYVKYSFPHLSITVAVGTSVRGAGGAWEVPLIGVTWQQALLGATP